jgi:DNA-binding GntR family transcriptional regulator
VQTLEPFRSDPGGETDEDTFVESNRAFHCGIADICGNPRLAALEYDLVQQFSRLIRVSLRHAQNSSVPDAISEHNAMISAIQSHDAEAASRLAYKHVESGQSRIMAALRRSAEAGEKISRTRICDRDRAQ